MNRVYLKDILTKQLGEGYTLESRHYGGLNISYVVRDKNNERFVVYLPNGIANKLIDRKAEEYNTDSVVNLGLTSEYIYFDTTRGIKIKRYIEGTSLDEEKEIDYDKVADLLHLLHDNKRFAKEDFHPFDRLSHYENKALIYRKEPNLYRELKDTLSNNIAYISLREIVFSHNDFKKGNIIKGSDDKYYVIDFEFAANNDPIFDIAAFADESLEEGETLLAHYYKVVDIDKKRRFYLWRIFISLQWYNLAVIKHYQKDNKRSAINYLKLANKYLEIAKEAEDKFFHL